MKKKTALQQLLDFISWQVQGLHTPDELEDLIIEKSKELLLTEREQMAQSWIDSARKISDEAFDEPMTDLEEAESRDLFNDYYTQTYDSN